MPTREDCQAGEHTSDNQGLCHFCGTMVNPDWYAHYMGEDCDQEQRQQDANGEVRVLRVGVPGKRNRARKSKDVLQRPVQGRVAGKSSGKKGVK